MQENNSTIKPPVKCLQLNEFQTVLFDQSEGEGAIHTKILTVLNKWLVTHSYGRREALPNGKTEDSNS